MSDSIALDMAKYWLREANRLRRINPEDGEAAMDIFRSWMATYADELELRIKENQ